MSYDSFEAQAEPLRSWESRESSQEIEIAELGCNGVMSCSSNGVELVKRTDSDFKHIRNNT